MVNKPTFTTKLLSLAVALPAATATVLVAAPAASADSTVGGCTGAGGGTCVQITAGSKNYSNRTQWVGWVTAKTYGGGSGVTKLESWGDGFYFATGVNRATANPSATWGAQRWVRSGTNVCAAATFTNGYRDIACVAIRV